MGWIPVEMMVPDVDLFRSGNAGGPRMNHLREGHDATVVVRNGVNIILADGGGISLLTKKGMASCYGQVIIFRNPSPIPRMRRMPIARKHIYDPTHGPWISADGRDACAAVATSTPHRVAMTCP